MQKKDLAFMRRACLLCDGSSATIKTACLIVKNSKVLAQAYNLLLDHDESKHERDRTLHSEAGALALAAKKGVRVAGATLYVTRFPCETCAKSIYIAGIKKVYYMSDLFTTGNTALPFFASVGILVEHLPEEQVWQK